MEGPGDSRRCGKSRLITGWISTAWTALISKQETKEIELYCHSSAKEAKEEGIKNRFEGRFEDHLRKMQVSLDKKNGGKRYEKVLSKVGRLKERFKRVARRYEIRIEKEENADRVKAISWEYKEQDHQVGSYCLRSNQLDLKEQELFDIFCMLRDSILAGSLFVKSIEWWDPKWITDNITAKLPGHFR